MARAWGVRAGSYRDIAIARAFLEGREHLAKRIARAVAGNPPRNADQVWLDRGKRVADGQAWPVDIQRWGEEAKAIAREASASVVAARRRTWVEWANEAWARKPGKLYPWCRGERGPSIVATKPEGQGWLMDPASVVGHATDCWAALWRLGGKAQEPAGLPIDELPGMPPLQRELLHRIATHTPVGKTGRLGGWGPEDFRALPRETYTGTWRRSSPRWKLRVFGRRDLRVRWSRSPPRNLTTGLWPRSPSRSLLPMVYKLWAAAKADMLKERFADNGHESACGQGLGKGADTAAWMGAVHAELGECQRESRLWRFHRL